MDELRSARPWRRHPECLSYRIRRGKSKRTDRSQKQDGEKYIRDVLTFGGAGFVVPVSGSITLMPGTGSNPSFRRVDVDVDTGRVKGIF